MHLDKDWDENALFHDDVTALQNLLTQALRRAVNVFKKLHGY